MKRSKSALLAWTLFAIFALYELVTVLLYLPPGGSLVNVIEEMLWNLLGLEFAFLAALIISNRPRNIIGRLMMALAVLAFLDFLSRAYIAQISTVPAEPTIPLLLVAYFSGISWLFLINLLLLIMLLFPNGRFLSPRWRWLFRFSLVLFATFFLFSLFTPSFTVTELNNWTVANPIGFLPEDVLVGVTTVWQGFWVILVLLCASAPFVRYRRVTGVQKEQIKWLFFAGGLFALIFLPGLVLGGTESLLADAWAIAFVFAIMAIPAAIAVAILRYRLYDIDVIIRKTLLYGALTGLLALVYFGSVVLLQGLVEGLTGESSPIIIVLSTLLIAALFTPLRRRLQGSIDRRFFRQKYDAQQVLAQFAETARDEVELEALTTELLRVTRETVQPESVTFWLRERRS